MTLMIELSIVIPVYNNEDTVAALTEHLQRLLHNAIKFEIIFVNDASKDNSLQVLQTLARAHDFVRLKNLNTNGGQNKALMEGFKEAKGEKIIVMDADLQDNLQMILPLIGKLENEVDAVYILRKGKYQSSGRMFTSFLLKGSIELLIGLPRKAGTFFIIRKKTILRLINLKCTFPYVTIMAFHVSDNVQYLHSMRNSNHGRSAYTFKKRLVHAVRAVSCAIQCRLN